MYKETPWTLNEKNNRLRKSKYIKGRQADLEVAVVRVKKFIELHKDKTFTVSQLAESLGLSEGTISSIMNRLATIGEVSVAYMQRPHWSPVFQHTSTAPYRVPFKYKKGDPILAVVEIFENDKNGIFTKESLLSKLSCSKNMIDRSLQILLTGNNIKLVGTEDGHAQYQHISGNLKGIKIHLVLDENYISLNEYLKTNKLENCKKEFLKELKGKSELFYTSLGICKRYNIEDLHKTNRKISKKGILNSIFTK